MTHILIVESNTPDMVARGNADADPFLATLSVLDPALELSVAEPYAAPFDPGALEGVDAMVFTGSGVDWNTADKRARPLALAMEAGFAAGKPAFGACNGMQLAAVVLGGGVGASPNGREVGVARDIKLTPVGRDHPMTAGRTDGFAVACVHRDEVQAVPQGAQILAGNAHSPVQAMACETGGVSFWGTQYHPECAAPVMAEWLRNGPADWAPLADDMIRAESDMQAASRLGATPGDLTLPRRATEIGNWLAHIRAA